MTHYSIHYSIFLYGRRWENNVGYLGSVEGVRDGHKHKSIFLKLLYDFKLPVTTMYCVTKLPGNFLHEKYSQPKVRLLWFIFRVMIIILTEILLVLWLMKFFFF